MRPLLWLLVGILIVIGMGSPVIYLTYASGLPDMDTPEQVETVVKRWAENERMGVYAQQTAGQIEKFEWLPLSKLNRWYVALDLAYFGCADYLAQPRESDMAFFKRVLVRTTLGSGGEFGAGRCDLAFAEHIASLIGFQDGIRRGMVTYRIHTALTREQLLRLREVSEHYRPGVIGAPSGAKHILNLDFEKMTLAEAAEFYIANFDVDEIRLCKVAAKITKDRDNLLDFIEGSGAATADELKRARAARPACLDLPEMREK